ncbi:GNAT family acetyltransferase [Edwardsiella anguillarum]|uniref:GNAT family acetyltransferase n=2 Tax=Edwardsiella anguillarum TaxID=1821960 RepID=UPI0009005CC7|nr:GNAT family acetyltransferase [Edwardsiella anguillarum]KAB0590555.1 GNAT family acetyltransferase [Edwardsiella anguillarum]UOU78436.1 GNAT family acetyltransferase [Edwardsiella anguillarum]UOU79952.1 GNAT family acetyltransferase [Edwardsiella anguillarum]
MSMKNSVMATAHCERAEALASRGFYRRAITELTAAAMCASASQIGGVVERRNELSRRVRCSQRVSGDSRMDYDNCVGSVL